MDASDAIGRQAGEGVCAWVVAPTAQTQSVSQLAGSHPPEGWGEGTRHTKHRLIHLIPPPQSTAGRREEAVLLMLGS